MPKLNEVFNSQGTIRSRMPAASDSSRPHPGHGSWCETKHAPVVAGLVLTKQQQPHIHFVNKCSRIPLCICSKRMQHIHKKRAAMAKLRTARRESRLAHSSSTARISRSASTACRPAERALVQYFRGLSSTSRKQASPRNSADKYKTKHAAAWLADRIQQAPRR